MIKGALGCLWYANSRPFPSQPKRGSERATVFKPTGIVYQLKMKQARQTYAEVQQRFGSMAFSLRSFEVRAD